MSGNNELSTLEMHDRMLQSLAVASPKGACAADMETADMAAADMKMAGIIRGGVAGVAIAQSAVANEVLRTCAEWTQGILQAVTAGKVFLNPENAAADEQDERLVKVQNFKRECLASREKMNEARARKKVEELEALQKTAELLQNINSTEAFVRCWQELVQVAQSHAENCAQWVDAEQDEVLRVEGEIAAQYQALDKTQKELSEAENAHAAKEKVMPEMRGAMAQAEQRLSDAQREWQNAMEKKRTYDTLRWIPIVNLFSELARAIENADAVYTAAKQHFTARQREYEGFCRELSELQSKIEELGTARRILQKCVSELDGMLGFSRQGRETAAEEFSQWEKRKRYYEEQADEILYLQKTKAPLEVFYERISLNPPAF